MKGTFLVSKRLAPIIKKGAHCWGVSYTGRARPLGVILTKRQMEKSVLVCTGGHIVHLGSALGQLDSLPLPEFKEKIRNAKTIQEIMDLSYPAQEIAEV